jgi:hypothetical protein
VPSCISSYFTMIFKFRVILAEKIKVKVYVNEDSSILADIELCTVMISIVFCSLIIHEFVKSYYYVKQFMNPSLRAELFLRILVLQPSKTFFTQEK